MHQNRTSFEHPTNLRPRRHHRSGMLTHLSDMDTVSVCSFRPQKPHMQIEMNEDVKTGPIAQVSFFYLNFLNHHFSFFSFLLLYCFLYYCCLISFSFHFLYFSFILFFFFYFLIFFNFFFFWKINLSVFSPT